MIDTVRNTVLSIISKDNRGYITPFEFNLIADQAQKDIFDNYIYDYSNAINKQNAHMHGTGYADIPGKIAEVIEKFIVSETLVPSTGGKFYTPGNEPSNPKQPYYKLNNIVYNNATEIEEVTNATALRLNNSLMTQPSTMYPVYVLNGPTIQVYPTAITSNVQANYIRYPKAPKWTYFQALSNGEPLFNQSAADYQDFELPISDQNNLVIKILQYAGVSIREGDIVQMAKNEEIQDKQEKI